MNILMVSSYLPYPLFSGGHIRLYHLIKELSKKHNITLVCEKRDYQTESDVEKMKDICKSVVAVDRKKQWTIANILKTGFSPYPFLMVGHANRKLKEKISETINDNPFDLVHVETFYVMQNLARTSLPVVLAEHNVEYLVYKRFANQAPFFLKPLFLLDVLKIQFWEETFWKKATKLVAVSNEEKEIMGREDVVVVPNGVDIKKYQISNSSPRGEAGKYQISKKEKTILFIGDFRWVQNRDAVEWLLKEIWPLMISNLNVKLWIVGKNIPESIRELTEDRSVIFDENAPDDTQHIFEKADLLLAPIRIGAGTSFKILEAMATGVPVVTTRLGIEGIEARNKEEVLLENDADGLAKQSLAVLQNEKLGRELAMNARKLIEEKYDWEKIARKLEGVYLSLRQHD